MAEPPRRFPPPSRSGYIAPCIPTRAYKVPAAPGWVHEIKHDGYRLQVRREGDVAPSEGGPRFLGHR